MRAEHLPLLHLLDADPEVMRYLTGRARTPEEIDAFWGPGCADTSADALGLGWWVGFESDTFVGWWDLGRSDSDVGAPVQGSAPEIGWRVRRDRWRHGLATEGGRALLGHAFDTVGVRSVWAETMAVNLGSRGVMRNLGMRHVRTWQGQWDDPLPGAEQGEVRYEITAAAWRAGHRWRRRAAAVAGAGSAPEVEAAPGAVPGRGCSAHTVRDRCPPW